MNRQRTMKAKWTLQLVQNSNENRLKRGESLYWFGFWWFTLLSLFNTKLLCTHIILRYPNPAWRLWQTEGGADRGHGYFGPRHFLHIFGLSITIQIFGPFKILIILSKNQTFPTIIPPNSTILHFALSLLTSIVRHCWRPRKYAVHRISYWDGANKAIRYSIIKEKENQKELYPIRLIKRWYLQLIGLKILVMGHWLYNISLTNTTKTGVMLSWLGQFLQES